VERYCVNFVDYDFRVWRRSCFSLVGREKIYIENEIKIFIPYELANNASNDWINISGFPNRILKTIQNDALFRCI
tara:strand:+ start:795 stop:1019 length:225 start_codon:yes stop_codon:yes gene_type:complete